MGYKVLLPQDVASTGKEFLLEQGYEIKMGSGMSEEAIINDVKGCDAILVTTAPITAGVLMAEKRLKVVARHGVGVDNIDKETAEKLGIYVTNGPLSNANTVAEHTMAFILALAKHMTLHNNKMRQGNFDIKYQFKNMDVEGKTVGLIGAGRIGTMVAQKAAYGFNMKVIAYDPVLTQDKVIPQITLHDWDYVFKNSDFVCLHLPATEETKGIIGEKECRMMKKSAYLINAARGSVINEPELIKALKEGEIAGVGLDVFNEEPPSLDNELLKIENIILTPHAAATTYEAEQFMSLHAAMGIHEVLSGQRPSWPVNNPVL